MTHRISLAVAAAALITAACTGETSDSVRSTTSTTVQQDTTTSAPTTEVEPDLVVEGVLYERSSGLLLCDPTSNSECSRGVDLGTVERFETALTTTSWSGRRSEGLVAVTFDDTGVAQELTETGETSDFVDRAAELPGYFSDGPPDIGRDDLFDGPVCGPGFVDVAEDSDSARACDSETVALGMAPLVWRLVDRSGANITIDTQELMCAGGGDQPGRRRVVIPVATDESVRLVPLIAPANLEAPHCGPNITVTLSVRLDESLADLPLDSDGEGVLLPEE